MTSFINDEITFSEEILSSELIEFEALIEKNYAEPDVFIRPDKSQYIEGNGNGGSMWPFPLAVPHENAEVICAMLNKLSLRDFEVGLIDTDLEHQIGDESYEMWLESNYPIYDSDRVDDVDEELFDDKHIESQQALLLRLRIARNQLLESEQDD